MLKTRLLVAMILGGSMNGQFVRAQSSQPPPERADTSINEVVVGPWAIRMPKGAFLLIRKGQKIGAVRFTSIEPGKEVGTGKATYESYFQGNGSSSFLDAKVVKRIGEINLKPLKGIGRLSFQSGQYKVRVGKWIFYSGNPGWVNMYLDDNQKDDGFEFAPTSAQNVNEIDVTDKRLRWFRFFNDKSISLSLSDLPK